MKRTNFFNLFACLMPLLLLGAYADEDYVQEDISVKKLVNIYSLAGHCSGQVCRDFNYTSVNEVAFFDLQPEVRIAPDGATYEVGSAANMHDVLVFDNSTFAHFPLHLFYALELTELDMRNCGIEHISWESFLMASKLVILLLTGNKIRHIENMTFNYASELQYLFLDDNRLKSLDAESFKGMKKLKHLDLSQNHLRTLPDGIFDDLATLQALHLNDNRLRVIDNDLLARNMQLTTVTLSTNRLRDLGENAFRAATKLLFLNLSHNPNLQTIVSNVNVSFLFATNCSLYRVNIYGSVANVDLRDNHIMELYFSAPEALVTLVLRNNRLQQIASLSQAKQLEFLDLADNPDMGDLPEPWQVDQLTRLDLSNTSLRTFPISSLATLPSLRKLNVSSNRLSEINPRNFKYLDKLTHFYIHANDWNCYNLNMLMDLLIRPNGMSYTVDNLNADFPGEYVNGVACMYRIEDSDEQQQQQAETTYQSAANDIDSDNNNASVDKEKFSMDPALAEINELRKEMKAIVGIYEQKFARVFQMFNDLNAKMSAIEGMNKTLWNQVTITV